MVRLEGYGDRKPVQLSGGQRQRVALARAIVNRPKVLLLDEPLGALDLKLRQEMQVFLKALQHELGMTFLYVTHDQEEALTMSDHVAVFNEGRIEQVGTPTGDLRAARDRVRRRLRRHLEHPRAQRAPLLRPPRADRPERRTASPATIADVVFVGAFTRYVVDTNAGERLDRRAPERRLARRARHAGQPRLARRGRVRDQGSNPPSTLQAGGQMSKRTWALVAVLAVGLALPAAGVSKQQRRHAEHDRVGGLHPAAVGEAVREGDRLQGAREVRRLLGRDGDADALGRRRPVRHGLGVRRREPAADLRQGRAGRSTRRRSPTSRTSARRSSRRRTTRSTASTTASRCSGARTRCSTTRKKVKPAPTSWASIYSPKYKGKVTVPDNPIQIADAALYLMKTQPSLGIKDPYELNIDPVRRGDQPAEEAEAADQEVLGARLGRDRPVQERRRRDRRLVAVPDEHAPGREGAGEGHRPEGGRDRLARHVDGVVEDEEPRLRLQVARLDLDAEGAGPAGDLLR